MKPGVAKAKGAKTEQIFADYLIRNGVPNAERRRLNGVLDKGDIAGWSKGSGEASVCVEVKNGGSIRIPQWLKELEYEMENSKADTGFIVVRPKGKPSPEDWFTVLPIDILMALLEKAGYLPTYD